MMPPAASVGTELPMDEKTSATSEGRFSTPLTMLEKISCLRYTSGDVGVGVALVRDERHNSAAATEATREDMVVGNKVVRSRQTGPYTFCAGP